MSDIVTTRIFSNGETGITAAKMNDIIGSSSIQTDFVASKPVASSTVSGDQLLLLKSGGTYARIDSSVFASSIAAILPSPDPEIWSVRLKSFNSVGNPTFECTQRHNGQTMTNPANGAFIEDRWWVNKVISGALTFNAGVNALGNVVVPGTNFVITRAALRITLTAQQASLAAGDVLLITQTLEGIRLRELVGDVSSLSLLVRSSVAGLSFGVSLRDPTTVTKSLVKLCTIPSANTWTLISLANLPVFPSGNFSVFPGAAGYSITITLACGTTFTAPANDTWQSGNFSGAVGQSNFGASPVNSTFDIAFVQHEPGSQCSTPMDCPFTQNLDEVLRYYQKSYDYAVVPGSVNGNGTVTLMSGAGLAVGPVRFSKSMAKVPTIAAYSQVTGTINTIRDVTAAAERSVTSIASAGETGFDGIFATGVTGAAGAFCRAHYIADSGW